MAQTQKIILTMIFLNIIIAGSLGLYQNPADLTFISSIEQEESSLNSIYAENREEINVTGGQSYFVKPSSGIQSFFEDGWDTIKIGGKLIALFMKGLLGFGLGTANGAVGGEYVIVKLLSFFRITFLILLVLEGYMLFKNRKTS